MFRFAGLEQVRDNGVSQVMESKAGQAGGLPQRAPGAVPLASRLCRIEFVVLARAPTGSGLGLRGVNYYCRQISLSSRRVRVAELVGPFQHSFNRVSRGLVQRDGALARLVLAVTDVKHALARRALDVPHLF